MKPETRLTGGGTVALGERGAEDLVCSAKEALAAIAAIAAIGVQVKSGSLSSKASQAM